MPVYLCQPGAGASEPWRHGIQVYAAPFAMDDVPAVTSNDSSQWNHEDAGRPNHAPASTISRTATGSGTLRATNSSGLPIRRVRHAEVVLVDDVCLAFERYWLRLRWPGRRGGFAGYIALGKVSEEPFWLKNEVLTPSSTLGMLRVCQVDFPFGTIVMRCLTSDLHVVRNTRGRRRNRAFTGRRGRSSDKRRDRCR